MLLAPPFCWFSSSLDALNKLNLTRGEEILWLIWNFNFKEANRTELNDESVTCKKYIFVIYIRPISCNKPVKYNYIFHRVKYKEDRTLFGRFITWNWPYIYNKQITLWKVLCTGFIHSFVYSNAVQRSNQQPEEEGDLETYLHVNVILFK